MSSLISTQGIELDVEVATSEQAIRLAGELLARVGAVSEEYTAGMLAREVQFSTALGMGFAFPHGTPESKKHVVFDQVVFLRLKNEISWGSERVQLVVALAASSDMHQIFLGNIANRIASGELVQDLLEATTKDQVVALLSSHDSH